MTSRSALPIYAVLKISHGFLLSASPSALRFAPHWDAKQSGHMPEDSLWQSPNLRPRQRR